MVVHETRAEPARGFVKSGHLTTSRGSKPLFTAVSDPTSSLYGQHLTPAEVADFVKPTDETLSVVSEWLTENGISSTPTGKTSIRTLAYSIPAVLQDHIDFFHPTTSFTRPMAARPKFTAIKAKRAEPAADVAPVSNAVPASCNTAIYGIPATPATQSTNKLGVSGFIEQFANEADLTEFLTNFRTDIRSTTTFTLQTLDGGTNTQTRADAGIEANLDTQVIIVVYHQLGTLSAIATGVPVTFISVGESNRDGVDGDSPECLTTSYGFDESDLSRAVATTLCNTYMQLGALGTSILFSSGDGGVSGSQSQTCTTFIPTLPSDCPLYRVPLLVLTGGITETAASFSSGGFSNYFGIPSYQVLVLVPTSQPTLITLGTTNSGKFNRTGRGFPDVAAQGENFEIAWDTELGTVDGTSCSTPTFASIIALLNDGLVAAGKPTLGFLNPLLYSAAGRAALNDIKTGNNPGCNTNGFPATTGWDPVTGLGTPNFAALKAAVGL
ncbi:family S53 protease [Mycena olivaceomarginata]|nr:family S53 protease [Mycena olivaceomarginata]